MQEESYAAIAYIAGRLILQVQATGIYDVGRSKNVPLSGPVSTSIVNVFDANRNCNISGTSSNGVDFSLYDSGLNAALSLSLGTNQSSFFGYDDYSKQAFSGMVINTGVYVTASGSRTSYAFQFGATTPYPVNPPQAVPASNSDEDDPQAAPTPSAHPPVTPADGSSGSGEDQQSGNSVL